jgi:hypothetical protein
MTKGGDISGAERISRKALHAPWRSSPRGMFGETNAQEEILQWVVLEGFDSAIPVT